MTQIRWLWPHKMCVKCKISVDYFSCVYIFIIYYQIKSNVCFSQKHFAPYFEWFQFCAHGAILLASGYKYRMTNPEFGMIFHLRKLNVIGKRKSSDRNWSLSRTSIFFANSIPYKRYQCLKFKYIQNNLKVTWLHYYSLFTSSWQPFFVND